MINTRKKGQLVLRAFRNIVLFTFAGASLGACSSNLPGLSSGTPSLAPATSPPSYTRPSSERSVEQAGLTRPAKAVSIAMAPIVGPPSRIAKKLTSRIAGELKKRNINVVKSKSGYKMRGYVVSSSEGNGAKLAYIWDLNNKAGRRKHRISGEKNVSGVKGANPWGGVNDKVIQLIARDTANQVAGWLVRKNGGSVKTASSGPRKKLRANRIPASRAPAVTASLSKRVIMAMVVPVTGAPGDGKISLTKAIKKRLYSKGIRLTSSRSSNVYQVRGIVQVGKSKKGSQAIRIDWRVYDPKGKRLGTVTQKNEIPPGSLNGSWGGIADAAAGAAADGISKLLPKSTRRL